MAINTVVTIVIGLQDDPEAVDHYIRPWQDRASGPARLAQLLNECAGGNRRAVVMAYSDEADGTEAFDYVTLAQASAVTEDTLTILGVVFTCKLASPSVDPLMGEYLIGASDAAFTDNLVLAINAHPALRDIVCAEEDGGDDNSVYIQYRCPGPFNFGTVATSNAAAFTIETGVFNAGAVGTQQKDTRGWTCGLHGEDPAQLTHA